MAEFKPTISQRQAIESRGSNILVSAGAGSGKTKVLTERLMAYLTDPSSPADLDRFLIITYTRAAAGELRGRIMEELSKKLAEDPGNRHLRKQSALCAKAQIGTIHSFCADLLRENCHLAGLSPDFRVLDEDRASAMKAAALDRVLEQRYEKSDKYPGFILLADTVGQGRDDKALSAITLTLHGKMQCHPRPELWAERQAELMNSACTDAGDTPWGQEILESARASAEFWIAEFDRLIGQVAGNEKIAAAYLENLETTAAGIRELLRAVKLGWDRAFECPPVEFPRLKPLRNSPDAELSERVKARRKACKSDMDGLSRLFYAPSEKLLAEIRDSAPAMTALLELTLDFDRAYCAEKRRAGYVDYSDLEHLAARLLTDESGEPTALARRLSKRYTEIMVDEYQDVSQVQDAVFRAISDNDRNLFMVGDVKQSIYRFRLADPEIFTQKYLSYANAGEAREGEARRIMLQENFRSRREILDCANAVFSLCMSRELGDIDYDADAALKYGAIGYEDDVPKPEILLIDLMDAAGDDEEETPDKIAVEARAVGRKILELMDSGMTVGGRSLEFGDIALLMRSANSVGGIYRRELSAMGIPADGGESREFFTSVEVSTVISMLSVIDNPHKDIPLIAVLRSPAFGFSADELSEIRGAKKDGDFYSALVKSAETSAKCAAFLKETGKFRVLAADMSASELLWKLINGLDLLAICSAMTDGRQRRANLMELAELSERFDATGYRGLHRFVLWLKQLAEKGGGVAAHNSDGSSVKIMTVHKSKGLEFPVVFLCDTARKFNMSDNRDTVLIHSKLGLGPKVYNAAKGIQYPSLARNAIVLRSKRETLSEEMRLMYVALTRPRERLYITAALRDVPKFMEKQRMGLSVPMSPQSLCAAGAPISWLVSAALADGEAHLAISVVSADGQDDNIQESAGSAAPDADAAAELARRLSFSYPHKDAQELPSKVTATELKGRMEQDADAESIAPKIRRAFRMPDFTKKDKPLTGTEKGIATHLALQYMDISETGSPETIKREIERLFERRFISRREKEAVDVQAIFRLFASPLGQRMRSADFMKREFRFSLLCSSGGLLGKAEDEKILLQGVVDCCIAENGRLTVIDYKTDNVHTEEEVQKRSAYYAGQISAYAAALSRIFNMEVGECVLYFLAAGRAVTQKVHK